MPTRQANRLPIDWHGQVTVIAKRHGQECVLQVSDNGTGIEMAERSKVLERFYRIRGTDGHGTGLGLAIAQEIAKLHGAQLTLSDAQSHPLEGHKGLLVSVYLHAPSSDACG